MVATLLFVCMIWCVSRGIKTRKDENGLYKKTAIPFVDLLFMILLVQSQVLSEIYFYIKMPYGCTMDFRYIMPLILGMALTMGCAKNVLTADGGKVSILLNRLLVIVTVALLVTTSIFFCVCV
jgi:hypothetical protein